MEQQPNNLVENTILMNNDNNDDPMNQLWNVSVDDDGQRIEIIDPNDPIVQRLLREEEEQEQVIMMLKMNEKDSDNTSSTSETILYLLQLIRERIKVELTYFPKSITNTNANNDNNVNVDDDNGMLKSYYLRLFAYSIHTKSSIERKQLIQKQIGNSMDVSTFLYFILQNFVHEKRY